MLVISFYSLIASLSSPRQWTIYGEQFEYQWGGAPHSRNNAGIKRYWSLLSAHLHLDSLSSYSDHYHFIRATQKASAMPWNLSWFTQQSNFHCGCDVSALFFQSSWVVSFVLLYAVMRPALGCVRMWINECCCSCIHRLLLKLNIRWPERISHIFSSILFGFTQKKLTTERSWWERGCQGSFWSS